MNEMIERVGTAALSGLLDRNGIKYELGDCKSEDSEMWREIVEETGRAAIEAMREPTEAMGAAAEEHQNEHCWGTWSTMIDAALESGK